MPDIDIAMKTTAGSRLLVFLVFVSFSFLFSFFSHVSYASVNGIDATVVVTGTGGVDCKPETLDVKSKGNFVTCYIELANADVNDIVPSSVKLEVVEKPGSPVFAKLHPQTVGDYDSDGVPDLMVKFDRATIEGIIGFLSVETNMTYKVSGIVGGAEFSSTDTVRVINPPTTSVVVTTLSQGLGQTINQLRSSIATSWGSFVSSLAKNMRFGR